MNKNKQKACAAVEKQEGLTVGRKKNQGGGENTDNVPQNTETSVQKEH